MPPTGSTKSYCNECVQETHHDLISSRRREWVETDESGTPYGAEYLVYEFLQCRGCENVSLRRTSSATFWPDVDIDYFPPAKSRRMPTWLAGMRFFSFGGPKWEIRELFGEVYSALFSGNNRVALMGTRAIVDVALTDKLGDDIGGFERKLDEARKKEWITPSHHKVLVAAIDAGSAAGHRAYNPDKEHLELVLDIVEHLVQLLYVLQEDGAKVAKATPPRPSRAPKGGTSAPLTPDS